MRPASSHVATHLERKKGLLPQYVRKNSPTLALEPKWRTRHSAQGLRYCRVKALPNQPYMTHTNTFNLMKTFGYPTSIGRWGFQDQGGCTPLPCLAGRCVSSLPSPRVQTPWNLSPACDAPGPRSVGVHDTSPTGLSQGSSNAQSKGLTHTKHTQHTRPRRWSNRPPNSH